MNVLLVSHLIQECNYVGDYYSRWPQLGIAYIASTLERKGHKVRILEKKLLSGPEYPNSKDQLDKVDRLMFEAMEDFKPNLIGLTATTPVIMDAYRTAKLIKSAYPELPIVLGGRHATSEPFYTLEQCPDIDIICRGEGEITMSELAGGTDLNKVKGIVFRRGNDLTENPNQPLIENLDTLPYPAWHLLDRDFYFRPNISVMRGDYMTTATMMTSRGCPYRCAFCQSPELLDIYSRGYIRYHSAERVIGEIEYLIAGFGVRGISFNDDMFSLDRRRALDICNAIVAKGINKTLRFTVNLRSDIVDSEMLDALKKAGCIHVVYGSESGSEATLKRMNKSLSVLKNIEAIQLTKQRGLTEESNIVIGTPGETEKDFLFTIDFLKKSAPDKIFISKFYPLPGTQFFKQLLEQGIIHKPIDWDEINSLYVENDDFTFADIKPRRFIALRNKLVREVVIIRNSLYVIKRNVFKDPKLATIQIIKMLMYLFFCYLPIYLEIKLKRIMGKISFKLRYIYRR